MKKIFTLLFLCMSALVANAQVLHEEIFNYPLGPLAGQGGWTEVFTGATFPVGEGRTVVNPPLTYSDGGGTYALSGLGNGFYMYDFGGVTPDNYIYKPFVSTPISSGVVYVTFLLKVNANLSSTNTEIFGLSDGTSAGPKVMIQKATPSSTFKIGTTRGQASTAAYKYGATIFTVGTTYLIVSKYDFATQTSSVFVNAAIGSTSEPGSPEAFDNTSTTIKTQLNNLWHRNQNAKGNFTVSGVRVSTTWAAAVAIPAIQLSAPIVGTASSISNTGFTANWTSVSNSSGYDVAVYQGATL